MSIDLQDEVVEISGFVTFLRIYDTPTQFTMYLLKFPCNLPQLEVRNNDVARGLQGVRTFFPNIN